MRHTAESAYDYLKQGPREILTRQPEMIFLDYDLRSVYGVRVAEQLRSWGYNGSIIMMTGHTEVVQGLKSHRSIDDVISKEDLGYRRPSSPDFSNHLNAMIDRGLVVSPLSMGIIGFGSLGSQNVLTSDMLKVGNNRRCVKSFSIFSPFLYLEENEGVKDIERVKDVKRAKALIGLDCTSRTTFPKSLREYFESPPEVTIISTGRYKNDRTGIRPSDFTRRDQVDPILLEKNDVKVNRILRMADKTGYKGLIIILSNPVGVLTKRALDQYPNLSYKEGDVEYSRVTSISADPLRIKSAFFDNQRANIIKYFGKDNIPDLDNLDGIVTLGDHGYEFPDLKNAHFRYRGQFIPFVSVNHRFSESDYVLSEEKKSSEVSRIQGFIAQAAEVAMGHPAHDTQKAVASGLKDIACNRQSPEFSFMRRVYMHELESKSGSTFVCQTPVLFDRNSMTVRADQSYNLKTMLNDPWGYWRDELIEQSEVQSFLYRSRYKDAK